jgi:hypothetical protein
MLTAMAVSAVAKAQVASETPVAGTTLSRPPIEIVSHKIGIDYYPMLDRPSSTAPPITADVAELPPTENERLARQSRRTSRGPVAPVLREDTRHRGILYSYLRVIDDAQLVQVTLKNTDTRQVKSIDWDFAFPRYENGTLLSRFDVSSTIEIKPGGKKTIKYKLPPDAKRCEVVKVIRDEKQQERISTFEAVCGQGFNDPQLQGQRQETISIKRITYADGTVWQPEP